MAHVTYDNVTWAGATPPPRANTSRWGAADPRIAHLDGTYYLTWDNCTQNCYPHRSTLLSTTRNPFDPNGWTLHGPLIAGVYTGGASLLLRDEKEMAELKEMEGKAKKGEQQRGQQGQEEKMSIESPSSSSSSAFPSQSPIPHLAFVGNSNTANAILLAESHNAIDWRLAGNGTPADAVWMGPRPGCWDAAGVAAGPQPERLSTGDYLYVYNIDTGFPYKPNPLGRCSIGWAILDGKDPRKIVARADEPLLTPVFPWETCPEGKGYICQEPMVVFTTGMKPLGNDTFYVFYGAADTNVGVATIKVSTL